MKRLVLYSVLTVLATALVTAGDASAKTKAKARTINGCLTKGDSADEYLLTGKDGSTWEAHSNGVALADHVGHEVAATGVVSHAKLHNLKEDTKDVAKDTGVKKGNKEHGHFIVTKLRMVSGSCHK